MSSDLPSDSFVARPSFMSVSGLSGPIDAVLPRVLWLMSHGRSRCGADDYFLRSRIHARPGLGSLFLQQPHAQ